jgi:hypothetical protein
LEGGYNTQVAASSVKATFDVLLDNPEIIDPLGKSPSGRKPGGFDKHIEAIKKIHHIT